MDAMSEGSHSTNRADRQLLVDVLEVVTDATRQHQASLTNWLFAVNAGGIGGLLTYIAAKGGQPKLVCELICFTIGLASIVLYRVTMYYWLLCRYRRLHKSIREFDLYKLSRSDCESRSKEALKCIWPGEALAWLSGIAAIAGVIVSVIGIWKGS